MPLETEIFVQVLIKVREQKLVVHAITSWVRTNEVAAAKGREDLYRAADPID